MLSVFIGAFVYSLGSLVLYRVGFYPEDAAHLVIGVAAFVVVAVVFSQLGWSDHLTALGSLDDSTASRAEALFSHGRHPLFGASELTENTVMPSETRALRASLSGYLQLMDVAHLQTYLARESTLHLTARPGKHILTGDITEHVSGPVDAQCATSLRAPSPWPCKDPWAERRTWSHGDLRDHVIDTFSGIERSRNGGRSAHGAENASLGLCF
ncbi:DUF2254 family protein [Dinoroseobacter sp. S124A]|uniref:DUF2254 family protein n=1 Tax=Dinoroseobacter sp. S124A TaxID=3415128 RepID=UPI003C7AEE14